MEKILTIDGRQVKFKSTAAYLLKYKAQFGRDAIQDLYKILESVDSKTKEVKDISALDLGILYDMVWALAKQADPNIPPPMEWLDEFDTFPLLDKEYLPMWLDMIKSSFSSSVESKKKSIEKDDASFKLTTDILILRALERGLSLSDFNEMTIGMIIDFIVSYNNENYKDEDNTDEEVRVANQSDFDRF